MSDSDNQLNTHLSPSTDEQVNSKSNNSLKNLSDPRLWVEHKTSDEESYYYNPKTRSTTWLKPENVIIISQIEYEAAAMELMKVEKSGLPFKFTPVVISSRETDQFTIESLRSEVSVIDKTIAEYQMKLNDWSVFTNDDGRKYYYNSQTSCTQWEEPQSITELNQLNYRSTEMQKKIMELTRGDTRLNSNKPIAKCVITGTPWCLVWTANAKYFFHNPSKRLSVWTRPAELIERSEVDEIISEPPEDVKSYMMSGKVTSNEDKYVSIVNKRKRSESLSTAEIHEDTNSSTLRGMELCSKAQQSYKERASTFKNMLSEKKVSVYSDWDNELHKIASDDRYKLLNAKERKLVFDEFVEGIVELVSVKPDRNIFIERADEERLEKIKDLQMKKAEFRQILIDSQVKHGMVFADFCAKFCRDERFRAVAKMRDREQMFNEFMEEKSRELRDEVHEGRRPFFDFLDEYFGEMESSSLSGLNWVTAKKRLNEQDIRFVRAGAMRPILYADYVKIRAKKTSDNSDHSKQERAVASIKKREEQVRTELKSNFADIGKEREHHIRNEAERIAREILAKLVTNDHTEWEDIKSAVRRDARYEEIGCLKKNEIKELFYERKDELKLKKRTAFRQLLVEIKHIAPVTKWREVRNEIKDDPRYKQISSNERKCEKEFDEYIKELTVKARDDFIELLKETKLINYKNTDVTMEDINCYLSNDKRYSMMDYASDERNEIISSYIRELHEQGPPPPPTASDPGRRKM